NERAPRMGRSPDWSEIVGRAHAEARDPARRHAGNIAVLGDAIELHLHVRVEVPVQADGPVVDLTALDRLVVEVEEAEAQTELPGAPRPEPLALLPVKVVLGNDAPEHSVTLVVFLVLAGQEVQRLDVATVVVDGPLVQSARRGRMSQELPR